MSVLPASEISQLRWRCRRGMLELDLLLNGYLDAEEGKLTAEQASRLDALLDYPDPLLLDLLLGNARSADERVNELIAGIREAGRNFSQAR